MKRFACGEVVPGCEWVGHGEGEEELLVEIAAHAHDAHGMDEVPTEVADVIRGLIREV